MFLNIKFRSINSFNHDQPRNIKNLTGSVRVPGELRVSRGDDILAQHFPWPEAHRGDGQDAEDMPCARLSLREYVSYSWLTHMILTSKNKM